MLRSYALVLLVCLIASPAVAQPPDFCNNNHEQGKPIDGRFMGLPYDILGHALAEKYCGAKPRSMKAKILGYIEKSGCGPSTEIYSEIEETISRVEAADLKQLASGGETNLSLSPQEVHEWAAMTTGALGGCPALVKAHDVKKRE